MADFKGVIQRAVDGLANNTPEARDKIYNRARQTVQRQLDALPEGTARGAFEKQKFRVEEAILEVESAFTSEMPDLEDVEEQSFSTLPVDSEPVSPTEKTPMPATVTPESAPVVPISEPDVPSAPVAPQFTMPEPVESGDEVADAELEPSIQAGTAAEEVDYSTASHNEEKIVAELDIPRAESVAEDPIFPEVPVEPELAEQAPDLTPEDHDDIISKAVGEIRSTLDPVPDTISETTAETVAHHDEIFGLGAEALPEARAAKPKKSPFVIFVALLLILAAGITYFVWRTGWDDIQNMFSASSTTQEAENGTEVSPTNAEATGDDIAAADDGSADQSSTDTALGDDKFNQRLNADGSEMDAGPAEPLTGETDDEGRSVASQSDDEAAASSPGTDGTGVADGSSTIQKMFFYETSLGLEQQAKYDGSVVWSEQTESDGANTRPYIEARIQVPDREIELLLTIKLNGDATLPVSHLIDLAFDLPEGFDGGEIEQVTEVKFKDSEEQTGVRLEAITAKIEPTFFIVGLQNDTENVIASNTALMQQKNWIDIPISYTNGRKALITLEKGVAGQQVFEKVLAAWAQNPIQ